MEDYGSERPNPKVVRLRTPCICKSGIVQFYNSVE